MTEKSATLTAFVNKMHETKANPDTLAGHTVRTLEQEEQIAFDGLKSVLEAAFKADGLVGVLNSFGNMAGDGKSELEKFAKESSTPAEAKQVFATWINQVYVPSKI